MPATNQIPQLVWSVHAKIKCCEALRGGHTGMHQKANDILKDSDWVVKLLANFSVQGRSPRATPHLLRLRTSHLEDVHGRERSVGTAI